MLIYIYFYIMVYFRILNILVKVCQVKQRALSFNVLT